MQNEIEKSAQVPKTDQPFSPQDSREQHMRYSGWKHHSETHQRIHSDVNKAARRLPDKTFIKTMSLNRLVN